jgi:DNA-binding transcriptional LysR family regulator
MQRLSDNQLRRLDLTLLLVFDEAVRSRKFGHAAARLGLTQSAISHAMTRLRDIFRDPLFIRQGNSVVPTPRALALAVPVARVLAELRAVLDDTFIFDPARLERSFKVSALDYVIATFLPGALSLLSLHAPSARMSLVSMGRADSISALADGRLDLAVGVYPHVPEGYRSTVLRQETFVVVCRHGHPVSERSLDLETFLQLDHLLVSAAGDFEGAVDVALRKRGRKRTVVAAIPQFLAALATVAESDAVLTVPEGVARTYAKRFDLSVTMPPLDLAPFEVLALAGPISSTDLAVDWLAQIFLQISDGRRLDPIESGDGNVALTTRLTAP